MADETILELTEAVIATTDVIVFVDDPSGTPVTKRDTVQGILDLVPASGLPNPEGIMQNGKLSVTVSANDLVVALKTLAGTDPTADDSVKVVIAGTEREITAALSVTLVDATNWMNLGATEFAALEQDLFAYLSYRAASSAVVIGCSRLPFANLYSDFDATNTNERHGAFSTAPASTDTVVVVGRFAATLSGSGTSHVWTVPTYTSANLIQRPIYETRPLSWLPTWTNLTVTSATVSYYYKLTGNRVTINEELTFGASTSISGSVTHTLPFSRGSVYGGSSATGLAVVRLVDATATPAFSGIVVLSAAATVTYVAQLISGTYLKQATLSSTIPFTWTTSDQITAQFDYFI